MTGRWTQNLRRTYGLFSARERHRLLYVFAAMLGAALLELVGVASIFPFLSILTNPAIVHEHPWLAWSYERFGFGSVEDYLIALGFALLGLILFSQAFFAYARWVQVRFNYDLEHHLSLRLLEAYLRRPYPYFLGRNTAQLNRNVLEDTGRIVAGIVNPILSLISQSLVACAILGLLLVVQPLVTLVLLAAVGGAYGVLYLRVRRKLRATGVHRNRVNETRYLVATEGLGGVKELKVLGLERAILDRFERPSKAYADANATAAIVSVIPGYLMRSLTFGGLLAILIALMYAGVPFPRIIPLMGLFAFAGYRLMPSLEGILVAAAEFNYREDLLRVIHADLVEPTPLTLPEGPVPRMRFDGEIRLDNVVFQYPGTMRPVLDGLNLVIPKNTSVAFVGTSGAGKSTVTDVLLGLLPPTQGALVVDGTPVDPHNVRAWQANIGYIPQEIYLSDDTIRRNIAYGLPEDAIDDAAVERAARTAHIHDFIVNDLPNGYATVVGERGVRLSGGQRQRIGIARALYRDPPVLALDEATSDIDNVTEANISQAIEELGEEKTLIIIAHRLTTVRHCDVVYVLEQGRILARGTYDSLVASNQHFQALAREIRR